jgi:hypothetical protein
MWKVKESLCVCVYSLAIACRAKKKVTNRGPDTMGMMKAWKGEAPCLVKRAERFFWCFCAKT